MNTKVCLALTDDLKAKLKEISKKMNLSQSSVMRLALLSFYEKNK